jgi:hypothetical protein
MTRPVMDGLLFLFSLGGGPVLEDGRPVGRRQRHH